MRKNAAFKTAGTRRLLCMDFSLLGAFAKLRKATISFVLSVCPSVRMEQLGSNWTDFRGILMFVYFFFENLSRKFKFSQNLTRITSTLHGDQYTFLFISRSRTGSYKNVEKIQIHFMYTKLFFSKIVPFRREREKVL